MACRPASAQGSGSEQSVLDEYAPARAGEPAQPEPEPRAARQRFSEAAARLEVETRRDRFFELSLDLLGIADLTGRMLQANPSWERVLGYSGEELHCRSTLDLIHPEDLASMREHLQALREKDATASSEGRFRCKDGAYRWLGWTAASAVADRVIYLFARDITAQKHAEQQIHGLNVALTNRAAELESANAELQREMTVRQQAETALKESNAELEAFAYSVSHDLRAPLRSMQGFAQALVEDCADTLGQPGLDYAQRIVSAGGRLDALIQDLLLYSRVSHRTLELAPVDMAGVVREVLGQLEVPIRDTRAIITCQEPFLPVAAHHATLVQVVGNLVSNAIKFVAPGVLPRVRIAMEAMGARARLSIKDNGIGIAPEYHTRIFRVFERLHGMDAYPGTGVGLAIVRKGVERMGGQAGVESVVGHGSEFWLELPRASPDLAD